MKGCFFLALVALGGFVIFIAILFPDPERQALKSQYKEFQAMRECKYLRQLQTSGRITITEGDRCYEQ